MPQGRLFARSFLDLSLTAGGDALAVPSDVIARAIAYVISEPADVDVNEILLRPTAQEF